MYCCDCKPCSCSSRAKHGTYSHVCRPQPTQYEITRGIRCPCLAAAECRAVEHACKWGRQRGCSWQEYLLFVDDALHWYDLLLVPGGVPWPLSRSFKRERGRRVL